LQGFFSNWRRPSRNKFNSLTSSRFTSYQNLSFGFARAQPTIHIALHRSACQSAICQLARRLAERARRNNQGPAHDKFQARSRNAEEQAELIRELLLSGKIGAGGDME
jgi:hypothetical protein